MTLNLGILLAFACAVATQLGFLYKHRGACAAAKVDIRRPLKTVKSLFASRWFAIGMVVALGAWLFGFPNALIFGILAMALNYIPYIGAACLTLIILGFGLVTFPSLSFALIPPAAFVALATIEGQFVTPAVLGHRLTLNPLMVLLALAFWAWLWGPIGAFLAVPLTMVGLVTLYHLFPPDESKLPD